MAKKKILMVGSGYIANSFVKKNIDNYNFLYSSRNKNLNLNVKNIGNLFELNSSLDGIYADSLIFSISVSSFKDTSIDKVNLFLLDLKIFLNKFKHSQIKKFIFLSSSSLYGLDDNGKKFLEDDVIHADSVYRIEKSEAENMIIDTLTHLPNKTFAILRISNPYGAVEKISNNGVINKAFLDMMNKKPTTIYNSGKSIRDFIYIDDLINFIQQSIELNISNNIFNIGSGDGTSLNQMISIVKSQSPEFTYNIEGSPDDIEDSSILDISKAKKLLLYTPKYILDHGVSLFYEHLKKKLLL
jgi:UDP-glucose 4-epimerase|tara:strand:- start:1141 stop:2037 length:897 start_codon:yes stop_codon:yes gene_type:complete